MKLLKKVVIAAVLVSASVAATALPVGPVGLVPNACEKKYSTAFCTREHHVGNTVGGAALFFAVLFVLTLCMAAATPVGREEK